MKKVLLLGLVLSLAGLSNAWAQTGDITGTVTDAESDETIPGVNVVLTEIDRGAATDVEGNYTISDVPEGTYTLRASFVGYQTFETEVAIEAGETVTRNIQLETGAIGLDEVVVTGYGTETRREVTGSISSINSEEITDIPVQNTESLLQGRAAGVTMATSSGNPGGAFEIDIRGEGSINAGQRPLYIVDGVQVSFSQGASLNSRSPLNSISPKDIESIEVLKDAAASSIYGAQAANGVVLITTKSGREGDTQVSFSYEGGVRQQAWDIDMMNRDQWLDFHVDAFGEEAVREDILPFYGYDSDTPFDQLRDYNWPHNFASRTGATHNVSMSARGGDANTQFYVSGGWESTEGAIQGVAYEELSFRTNFSQQFTSWFDFDAKINLSKQSMPGVCQDGFFVNCPLYQAVGEEAPISYPYLDNGDYNPNTESGLRNNPAVVINEEDRDTEVTQILGNISPTFNLAPWLTLRGTAGIDWQYLNETDYESPIADPGNGGSTRRHFNTVTNITGNVTLEARQTFNDVHNLSAMLGSEYLREFEQESDYGAVGFNNSLLKVQSAASSNSFFEDWNTEYRLMGFFGQGKYNYDQRYILTFTGRYDGTSRFGADRRWGFFPSVSAAWRLSEEPFFDADFVDELKFRGGYGTTGNSRIGNFAARGLFNVSGSYNGQVGFNPSQLANTLLTWEEKREINLGVDWSLWNGRLTGSFEAYRSTNHDLLLNRPLPQSSGFGSITENIGKVQNRGLELSISTVNLQDFHGFTWSTRFNAGVNQNEILELSEGVEALDPGGSIPYRVGHSLEARQGAMWAGVNPADGRPMWYDQNGNLTYNPVQSDDVMQDGAEEDVEGGFGNRLSYGGLSLDVFFQFMYGANTLPEAVTGYSVPNYENATVDYHENRWREPGDIAKWPRAVPYGTFDSAQSYTSYDSQNFWNASYIRLKNVSLSYRLPASVAEKLRVSGARVYATGVNLLTWTTYPGYDPEVSGTSTQASYPAERQINLGIQVDL